MNEGEINEMCRSALSTLPKTTTNPTDVREEKHNLCRRDEIEINELRGRLDRRNALLDVIRKAYHRDVLLVKEFLTGAKRQGITPTNVNADSSLGPSLESVPSVDLRETFRLFAPHECELRVRPCWSCGGRLEVIHRESARIAKFKHTIQLMEEKEKDLRMELVDTKVNAQEDRKCLVDVMERSKVERNVLLKQILSLKHQVADRNALDDEVKYLRREKKNLEAVLAQQKPILADHKRLLVEIEEVKDEREQWKAKFHEQEENNRQLENKRASLAQQLDLLRGENKQLQQHLAESKEQFRESDDRCSTLSQDLSKSEAGMKEIESCLQKAEQAIDELETGFQQERQQMQSQIRSLESDCLGYQAAIKGLEEEARNKLREVEYYRDKTVAALEGARRRGLIATVPQNSNAMFQRIDVLIEETETLRQKTGILFNLLLSFIRSVYETCLVQEKLLVDNGSELHTNKSSLGPTNDKAQMVLDHLERGDESDTIEWASVLSDETDQRHILGNLQNRTQMGQFSLDRAFQGIYKSHQAEMHKCQDEHRTQMEERRSRIWELERMLTEAITINRKYEEKMIKMREKYDYIEPKIESIRCTLRKTHRECLKNTDITSNLKVDYEKMRTVANRLLDQIKVSKQKIQAQKDDLAKKQEDIHNRNLAIEQLEKLLEKITHKYAENERLRIKVTHEAAVQAVPAVTNAASHADFLSTPLRRGLSEESPNKHPIKNSNALLPGHIFNITDLGVSVQSGLQYRRAIDKL